MVDASVGMPIEGRITLSSRRHAWSITVMREPLRHAATHYCSRHTTATTATNITNAEYQYAGISRFYAITARLAGYAAEDTRQATLE